jgi:antitoxin ParD1/3/4
MNITLKPEQERLIQQQVALGRFRSTDEALDRALQLLHEEYNEVWIAEVQAKVDEAKVSAERGEVLPLDVVMTNLQDKFRQAREKLG